MKREHRDAQLLNVPLLRGGTFELWPGGISVGGKTYALGDLASARLINDRSITVPADSPPWPAVQLTLRDGRLILLTPSDPLDAWQVLEALFHLVPLLRTPLPPMPGRAQWRGGSSSVPGAGGLPRGIFGAPDTVESGSTEAVLAGITHLSFFFAPIVLPLIIWLASRERSPYVARQAKQALAFQVGLSLGILAVLILWFVAAVRLAAASAQGNASLGILVALGVLFVLLVALGLFALLFSIFAAVQTFRGRPFSYPLLRRL